VERRIAPSARIEEAIEEVLLGALDDPDRLTELGRLGAQLVLQRAVEEEVKAFLGRARYERAPDARGSRNGHRPKRIQTAEGELVIAMPQVRDTLTGFVSSVIPDVRGVVRTRPLEALVIGAYVRGLSDRDIESLAREAGLGQLSRSTVSTVCRELRDRYRAFRARSLAEVRLLALFCDAIYLPVRPEGPKEGVLVAWGFTLAGERILLLYPPGLEYIAAYYACLAAGAVAVPAYPPRRNRNMIRIAAIAEDAQAKAALVTSDIIERSDDMLDEAPLLKQLLWLATDEIASNSHGGWQPAQLDPKQLAMLQYTSGSTGTPKGVMLTHANLMHNSAMITYAFEHSRSGENEVALDERSRMGRIWVPQAETGAFFDDTVSRYALTL